jgi:hypothetical protein
LKKQKQPPSRPSFDHDVSSSAVLSAKVVKKLQREQDKVERRRKREEKRAIKEVAKAAKKARRKHKRVVDKIARAEKKVERMRKKFKVVDQVLAGATSETSESMPVMQVVRGVLSAFESLVSTGQGSGRWQLVVECI